MFISLLKKIFLKLILLSIIFVIINFLYLEKIHELDLQKHSPIVNRIREIPNETEILYIGESSNTAYHEDDNDKRAISEFLTDFLPSKEVFHISKPASHAGIYKVLLSNIPDTKQIKTVIVTLNLRSFNAQWIFSDLETSLQKNIVLLNSYPPIINRFLLSFKGYDIKTVKERELQFKAKWQDDSFNLPFKFRFSNVHDWDNHVAEQGIKDKKGQNDNSLTELACHYIKGYGFQINFDKHPRIKDFNAIIDIANDREWNLIFNLLPENTERAMDLVGSDLTFLMNSNSELLVKYFQSKGVTVVNNLNLVPNEQFIDQNWTTEHYKEKGRKIIASEISEAIILNHF